MEPEEINENEPSHAGRKKARRTALRAEAELLQERRRQIALGLLAGMTNADMARNLGVSRQLIQADITIIRAEWREERNTSYQEYVDQEMMRLDRLATAMWPAAMRGNAQAVDTCLKVSDRRVRILGLDAPEKHTVTITSDSASEEVAAKLEALAASIGITPETIEAETA
jgi:DNA-binding XRE family transcriptional regulator